MARPTTLERTLAAVDRGEQGDAAIAQYRAFRRETMPFGRYNFGEWSLNELARTLTQQRRSAGAVAILELNAEFYPGSAAMDMVLGDLYRVGGEREKALVRYRMALEKQPNTGRRAAALTRWCLDRRSIVGPTGAPPNAF